MPSNTTEKLEKIKMVDSKQEENFADNHGESAERVCIAIDLDGTLAEYHGWKGDEHIGDPIPSMVEKLISAYAEGKEIWIFSARFDTPERIEIAEKWLTYHDLMDMVSGCTNIKMRFFKEIWDDRAKQVIPNNGQFLEETPSAIDNLMPSDEEICKQLGITEKALKVARLMSLPVFNYQHGGSHYKDMLIEPAVYVAANKLGAEEGNVIKYTSRHPFKNGEQDIDKAIHNLQMVKETRY